MRNACPVSKRLMTLATLSLTVAFPLASLAQYKVIGPDGKVSYSDRPPAQAAAKVQEVAATTAAGPAAPAANLPLELRQVVARYPVTLYALKSCEGCEAGRQLLRQRGIPYTEKVVNDGEGEALQKATGSRQIPALTIGSQVLRGFSADQWSSYLDAAGYPKQSRLPSSYVAPAPVPLVDSAAPAPSPDAGTAAPPPPAPIVAPPPAPGGIRF